jgi:hypothetical protein
VTGAAAALQTTSTTVATTVDQKNLQDLPLSGRNTLPFALVSAGAQQGVTSRDSTFEGMPGAGINITLNGIANNADGVRDGALPRWTWLGAYFVEFPCCQDSCGKKDCVFPLLFPVEPPAIRVWVAGRGRACISTPLLILLVGLSLQLRGTLRDNFDRVSTMLERRQSKRVTLKVRASLIFFSLRFREERCPCLIVDRSQDGFRLQVGSGLRRGQLVDLILDADPSKPVRCRVVWIGEPGSNREGQAGLQTVQHETT